mgnify:CR=1 FL=1|tara:strand:+ start:237 stop:482 length:246 start_codon:yes stop_codon:yes gene_type:complete
MKCFNQKEDRVPIGYLSNKKVIKEDIIEEINESMENMSFANLQILTLVAGEFVKSTEYLMKPITVSEDLKKLKRKFQKKRG